MKSNQGGPVVVFGTKLEISSTLPTFPSAAAGK